MYFIENICRFSVFCYFFTTFMTPNNLLIMKTTTSDRIPESRSRSSPRAVLAMDRSQNCLVHSVGEYTKFARVNEYKYSITLLLV